MFVTADMRSVAILGTKKASSFENIEQSEEHQAARNEGQCVIFGSRPTVSYYREISRKTLNFQRDFKDILNFLLCPKSTVLCYDSV